MTVRSRARGLPGYIVVVVVAVLIGKVPFFSSLRFCYVVNRSPPKEEDDMRAAEVLQGLKGVGGTSG